MPQHTPTRVIYRYLSGRPLDGRPGYPYLKPGPGRWPGYRRQLWRLAAPAVGVAAYAEPVATAGSATAAAAVSAYLARQSWQARRFRREYVDPTLAAINVPLGGVPVRLHIDPGLGTLVQRLARPMSPAEVAVRRWYGAHVEPVVRAPGQWAMRGWWTVRRVTQPATDRLEVFRRPRPEAGGPRIELRADIPYLTGDQRSLISAIINSKIPVSNLVETWHQVGAGVTAVWTPRRQPPAQVGYDEITAALPGLAEHEFFLGLGVGGEPVTVSVDDDSPHIAVSAGSGAGKSVLAQAVAAQVLARGGRVLILDRKGSHRWAILPDRSLLAGVDYCTKPAQMHAALVRTAELADERNTLAMHEPEGWDPGPRVLVICEELNATIAQLVNHWAEVRDRSEPKRSPAITALGELLFMGRSAKVNVLAIAQMLTARAIGGPEARENFGVRLLSRHTRNAWKMLVPEAPYQRPSRHRGRWHKVVGGQATEVQVVYMTGAEIRRLATTAPADLLSRRVPDSGLTSDVPGYRDMVTLREAIDEGAIVGSYEAAKKRVQRGVKRPPAPCGKRGQADLYSLRALREWDARVRGEVLRGERVA